MELHFGDTDVLAANGNVQRLRSQVSLMFCMCSSAVSMAQKKMLC